MLRNQNIMIRNVVERLLTTSSQGSLSIRILKEYIPEFVNSIYHHAEIKDATSEIMEVEFNLSKEDLIYPKRFDSIARIANDKFGNYVLQTCFKSLILHRDLFCENFVQFVKKIDPDLITRSFGTQLLT